jgi:hypothetical protein
VSRVADFSKHLARMRAAAAQTGDGPLDHLRRAARSGMSFASLAENISRQLASSGGRPALEGTVGRKKIPLQSGDWQCLERAVAKLQRQGVRSSAGQVASVLLHEQIARLDEPAPRAAKTRRTNDR